MPYKIKFRNALTEQDILSDEIYDTPEDAREAIEKDILAGNYQAHIVCQGFVEVDKPKVEYDLTDDGKGKKYDSGKSMVGTLCRVFPRALLGIGQCIRFGQGKYPNPKNWSLVEDGLNRYTDSLMRHLLKMFAGQEIDPETKLPHIFHVCWNALAIAEFYIKEHAELEETLFK